MVNICYSLLNIAHAFLQFTYPCIPVDSSAESVTHLWSAAHPRLAPQLAALLVFVSFFQSSANCYLLLVSSLPDPYSQSLADPKPELPSSAFAADPNQSPIPPRCTVTISCPHYLQSDFSSDLKAHAGLPFGPLVSEEAVDNESPTVCDSKENNTPLFRGIGSSFL